MASSVSSGGFTFSLDSVGGTWFWTVQASNIRGSTQLYQVCDIKSPFGLFANVNLPLPGDVVLAMSDSLQTFMQQLSPKLSLVSPGTTTFALTVTEGDPASLAATIPFQNVGAFGSFLTVTATPDAAWLSADPKSVSGLNKNDQGQFTIDISPSLMLATSSPYTGHVQLQDNRSPATVIPVTFNVTVLPRPTISTDVTVISLTYSITTGPGGSQQCNISNTGLPGSKLNVAIAKVQNQSPWLAFVPTALGPLAATVSAPVTFSVVPSGVPLIPGTYSETMIITSPNATNSPVTVVVNLVVSP